MTKQITVIAAAITALFMIVVNNNQISKIQIKDYVVFTIPTSTINQSIPDISNAAENMTYQGIDHRNKHYYFDVITAHNYLAGRSFYSLNLGDQFIVTNSFGLSKIYVVTDIAYKYTAEDQEAFVLQHYILPHSIILATCYPLPEVQLPAVGVMYITALPLGS